MCREMIRLQYDILSTRGQADEHNILRQLLLFRVSVR